MEIIPNLHWLAGTASNVYLWIDQSNLFLVDTGMPRDMKAIDKYLLSLGLRLSDISRIFLTHADIDHVGGAYAIQSASGAAVFAGAETCEHLAAGSSPHHLPTLMQWISKPFSRYRPIDSNALRTLADGDEIDQWQAISTPGHTSDHHSFWFPAQGILFAGDALYNRGGKLQLGRKFMTANAQMAAASAMTLLKLTPAVIACGHGPPIMEHDADLLMVLFNELRSNEDRASK